MARRQERLARRHEGGQHVKPRVEPSFVADILMDNFMQRWSEVIRNVRPESAGDGGILDFEVTCGETANAEEDVASPEDSLKEMLESMSTMRETFTHQMFSRYGFNVGDVVVTDGPTRSAHTSDVAESAVRAGKAGVFAALYGSELPRFRTVKPTDPEEARRARELEAARQAARARMEQLRPKVKQWLLAAPSTLTWDDVVGNAEAKSALVEAVEGATVHAALHSAYGKKPAGGILLYGPPGCGKTMFGRAAAAVVARQAGAGSSEMFSLKGDDVQSFYVGVCEERIRLIYEYARSYAVANGRPMVVFVDEAEVLLPMRGSTGAFWHDTQVAAFLTAMQGMEGEPGALTVLATNRPECIDPAVLREGRVDRRILVGRPSRDDAREIALRLLRGLPVGGGLTAEALADVFADRLFSRHSVAATLHDGDRVADVVTLGDVASGALVAGLVERAKTRAIARDVSSGAEGPSGLDASDAAHAVQQSLQEASPSEIADECRTRAARMTPRVGADRRPRLLN